MNFVFTADAEFGKEENRQIPVYFLEMEVLDWQSDEWSNDCSENLLDGHFSFDEELDVLVFDGTKEELESFIEGFREFRLDADRDYVCEEDKPTVEANRRATFEHVGMLQVDPYGEWYQLSITSLVISIHNWEPDEKYDLSSDEFLQLPSEDRPEGEKLFEILEYFADAEILHDTIAEYLLDKYHAWPEIFEVTAH